MKDVTHSRTGSMSCLVCSITSAANEKNKQHPVEGKLIALRV